MKEFQPLALVVLTAAGVALIVLAKTTDMAAIGGMLVGIALCAAIRMGWEITKRGEGGS